MEDLVSGWTEFILSVLSDLLFLVFYRGWEQIVRLKPFTSLESLRSAQGTSFGQLMMEKHLT